LTAGKCGTKTKGHGEKSNEAQHKIVLILWGAYAGWGRNVIKAMFGKRVRGFLFARLLLCAVSVISAQIATAQSTLRGPFNPENVLRRLSAR
jgi:hypothetical protein